jgi:hypothetical protein
MYMWSAVSLQLSPAASVAAETYRQLLSMPAAATAVCIMSAMLKLLFRAKNSYSIERRPIDYVPTATLWTVS